MFQQHQLITVRKIQLEVSLITKQNQICTRGAQLDPIGIPLICLYNFEPNHINILSKR